jgi:hypothetical protein
MVSFAASILNSFGRSCTNAFIFCGTAGGFLTLEPTVASLTGLPSALRNLSSACSYSFSAGAQRRRGWGGGGGGGGGAPRAGAAPWVRAALRAGPRATLGWGRGPAVAWLARAPARGAAGVRCCDRRRCRSRRGSNRPPACLPARPPAAALPPGVLGCALLCCTLGGAVAGAASTLTFFAAAGWGVAAAERLSPALLACLSCLSCLSCLAGACAGGGARGWVWAGSARCADGRRRARLGKGGRGCGRRGCGAGQKQQLPGSSSRCLGAAAPPPSTPHLLGLLRRRLLLGLGLFRLVLIIVLHLVVCARAGTPAIESAAG